MPTLFVKWHIRLRLSHGKIQINKLVGRHLNIYTELGPVYMRLIEEWVPTLQSCVNRQLSVGDRLGFSKLQTSPLQLANRLVASRHEDVNIFYLKLILRVFDHNLFYQHCTDKADTCCKSCEYFSCIVIYTSNAPHPAIPLLQCLVCGARLDVSCLAVTRWRCQPIWTSVICGLQNSAKNWQNLSTGAP